MRALMQFFLAFFWVGLVACGGGGNEESVVYRNDGVLVVDGREYLRRAEEEIKNEFGEFVQYDRLNLLGKPDVEKNEIEEHLREHGLLSYLLDCELWADENRCSVRQIVVPAEWGDQWRRAMGGWDWVENVYFGPPLVSPDQ